MQTVSKAFSGAVSSQVLVTPTSGYAVVVFGCTISMSGAAGRAIVFFDGATDTYILDADLPDGGILVLPPNGEANSFRSLDAGTDVLKFTGGDTGTTVRVMVFYDEVKI